MAVSEHAGLPADPSLLVDVDRLVAAYYDRRPDVAIPAQRVAFGTSGHRGSSLTTSFNEAHIVATTAAICRYRRREGIDGPLFIGRDTHALSGPAFESAVEVLVADGVDVRVDSGDGYTPTPAVSHAILVHNRGRRGGLADGIVPTRRSPARSSARRTRSWPAVPAMALPAWVGFPSSAPAGRPAPTTSWGHTSRISAPWSTWTPSARPACISGSTRWAAPASPIGGSSASGTAWT
jgi:hypothetical protein